MAIREDQDVADGRGDRSGAREGAGLRRLGVLPALAVPRSSSRTGSSSRVRPSICCGRSSRWSWSILGGIGTVAGPIVGAAVYEWLRGFLITSSTFASFQLAIAGVLLLVTVLFVTAGLVGWLRQTASRSCGRTSSDPLRSGRDRPLRWPRRGRRRVFRRATRGRSWAHRARTGPGQDHAVQRSSTASIGPQRSDRVRGR